MSDVLSFICFVLGAFLAIIGIPGYLSYRYEKKLFNDGKCATCDKEWRSFDMASDGSVGYTCDCCDDTVWLSWYSPKSKTPRCFHYE